MIMGLPESIQLFGFRFEIFDLGWVIPCRNGDEKIDQLYMVYIREIFKNFCVGSYQ